MIRWTSPVVCPDPLDILWHYATGQIPDWVNGHHGPVVWKRYTHCGIQRLDNIQLPRKQKRYIFSPAFELRFNTAFDEVVCACADLSREGVTWITCDLLEGYKRLRQLGYAYSAESWSDGKLVGGLFGVHIGGYISVESMFHRVSNASKAAYGRLLLHLRERGFEVLDTNFVSPHLVNYGEEWVPQWQFDQMLRRMLRRPIALLDGQPVPHLPWQIRMALPVRRVGAAVARRLRNAAAMTSATASICYLHLQELVDHCFLPLAVL